jgi:hypothetical protein
MDNPETLATWGTQDTGRRQIKHNNTQKHHTKHNKHYSGTPTSSTTKTGGHDIAEILLKVALKHKISNQSIQIMYLVQIYMITTRSHGSNHDRVEGKTSLMVSNIPLNCFHMTTFSWIFAKIFVSMNKN